MNPEVQPPYVRYSDAVEVKQPDEEELSRQVKEVMSGASKKMFDKHRHAIRDAHAKSHGILRATVQVYENLPEPLAQGVFQIPRTYPAIIRLSTSYGAIQPDTKSFLRGLAIKLIGVPGDKLLPEEKAAVTQDFLLANYPIIPTGTISDYLDQQKQMAKAADGPELLQTFQSKLQVAARKVKQLVGVEDDPNRIGMPGSHLLGDTYFSMAALRYGSYIAKIAVFPLSDNVTALQGKDIDAGLMKEDEDSFLSTIVSDFFKAQSAEYELRVQLCTNLETMPVEDGSVQWPEKESPYLPVARISIPQQDPFGPARRVYGDDVLSFNPFHCLPEHRPLGNIMRVRRLVYEASSQYRHQMNAVPRKEPASIEELPE